MKNSSGGQAFIAVVLMAGMLIGFFGQRFLSEPRKQDEKLYDAPDSPAVPFKTWRNGNWIFKLSGENEATGQIALLQNTGLPFTVSINGAMEPKFFNVDVKGSPHKAYGAVSLVGNPQSGEINEIQVWSTDKLYRLKRNKAGEDWALVESALDHAASAPDNNKAQHEASKAKKASE